MSEQEDLKALFREEAAELIDRYGVLVESIGTQSTVERRATIEELLRVIHNLKGASRTIGNNGMTQVCHRIEEDLAPYKYLESPMPQATQSQFSEATVALLLLLDEPGKAPVSEATADNEQRESVPRDLGPEQLTTIRVDTARFDTLMGFSGDLLMSRARMEERHRRLKHVADILEKQMTKEIEHHGTVIEAIDEMRGLIQSDNRDLVDFGYLTDEINQTMKRLRMVPLHLAEREWREVVYKVASATGKSVNVTIHTGTIQLDKQVLDQLRDPMMHLLRNAVDHGIEPNEERQRSSKPAKGTIDITASLQGQMVQIKVRDDGRGIDRDKVKATARRAGLLPHERIADDDLLDLLFNAGFSTADRVTDLSGRGVGLDVVRSRIEALGGRVSVRSTPGGKGTSFVLSVPISVLSTIGLHAKSGANAYAFPLEYVQRTVKLDDLNIAHLDGHMVLKQENGDPVRLVRLATLVGEGPARHGTPDKVVILSRSNVLLGVLVDSIEDQFEFVTRPLPWNLEQTPGVSGGSLRPDGTVVVVLDVPYLFEQAGSTVDIDARSSDKRSAKDIRAASHRVLVVDDSLASRTVQKNILLDAGCEVSLAEDGEAAWEQLKQQTFDLLVSDVDMPKLNGLELTRRVRDSERFRDLPVILITSLDSPEQRAAGANAGADEYIVKGTFDQQALSEVIARYL